MRGRAILLVAFGFSENHRDVLSSEVECSTVSKLITWRIKPILRRSHEILRFHYDDGHNDDHGHDEEKKSQNTVEESPAANEAEFCRTAIVDLMLPFT